MSNKGLRLFTLIAVLAIVLSQIMCRMPKKEDAIKPPDDDANLPERLAGVFDVTITDVNNNCPDDVKMPEFGPIESFEFVPNGIFVNTPNGKIWFGQTEEHRYCNLDIGKQMVCISNLSETGYLLTGYEEVPDGSGSHTSEECYSATHLLTNTIDESVSEDVINEVPDEENEVPPAANDTQLQPEEPPEPELQPDPEPEDCNAGIHVIKSGSKQDDHHHCTCAYRLWFENSHSSKSITILLKKTVDLGDGPVTRWEMHTIAPGVVHIWDSYQDENCAVNQVDAISAYYDDSQCHDLRRSQPDEINAMAVPMEVLCTEWTEKGE